jgi:hypothetical protein
MAMSWIEKELPEHRMHNRRTAEKGDELAALHHPITSVGAREQLSGKACLFNRSKLTSQP